MSNSKEKRIFMDLETGILTRRSIRMYDSSKKVSPADIDDILNMAMHAPSAHNRQSWEFVVITDPEVQEKVMKIHPWCAFLKDAGAGIMVCGNIDQEYDSGFWICDAAAATMNILHGAKARGLGSCWCAIYPNAERTDDFKRLFKLPSHIEPFSIVVVGHAKMQPPQPGDRFKREKIHRNSL